MVAPEDVLPGGDVVDAVLELAGGDGLVLGEPEDRPREEAGVVAVAEREEPEGEGGEERCVQRRLRLPGAMRLRYQKSPDVYGA